MYKKFARFRTFSRFTHLILIMKVIALPLNNTSSHPILDFEHITYVYICFLRFYNGPFQSFVQLDTLGNSNTSDRVWIFPTPTCIQISPSQSLVERDYPSTAAGESFTRY